MVQQFCTLTQKSLIFKGFSCFRGKKQPPFTISPFLEPFGLERVTFVVELYEVLCYNIFGLFVNSWGRKNLTKR